MGWHWTTLLPKKCSFICCKDSSFTDKQRDLGIYYRVLIFIDAGHSVNTRGIYQKASVCVHVLKLLCSAQAQVISSTEDEAAVQRLGPSAPALTMPEEHSPALPDSNTRSIQYGLGSKEQTETNYSSSASPWGYFKSKRYGFVPWTSCQKKSVAQQLLKQCSGRRELPARLTQ